MEHEIFGEMISSYSRAEAIEDGVLVDISKLGKEAGFKFPVAVTSGVYGLINYNKNGQSFDGRAWDVLSMLRFAIKTAKEPSRIIFKVLMVGGSPKKLHLLKAVCGPGDNHEPVITIMFPEED